MHDRRQDTGIDARAEDRGGHGHSHGQGANRKHRLPRGGYALRLEAPLENFPSADAAADTARVNATIERMVYEAPEQYLWVHKRFKTRPPGAPAVY